MGKRTTGTQTKLRDRSNFNWNLLRTFLVIAEENSITRAAERLSLRQPTVSYALKRLEETLNVQLIDRSSRSFALTSNGNSVLQACTEILQSVTHMTKSLVTEDDETTGALRIMTVSHVQSDLVDESVRLLHQRHPRVLWQLDVANSSDIVREVAQERVAIGICLLMKPIVGLKCRLLFREHFGLYCGSEHPLFGRTDTRFSDLQRQAFVSFACARDEIGFEPMTTIRRGIGLAAHVVGYSNHLEEVRRLIVNGVGIGILPQDAVVQDVESGALFELPIAQGEIGADVYLVTNPNMTLQLPEIRYLEIIDELLKLMLSERPNAVAAPL
ncbi:CysJI operon transcriptional activator [Agrobacterium rosae]|uniref:HTH-type transcriptional regulator TtuA n=2 Tax=Agrobacterium rosae TaxID=1972867 RepID=A0A1R3U1N9_9HYPH|nr:CysJI operon transcriptional activator [Agrobacterium rosae]